MDHPPLPPDAASVLEPLDPLNPRPTARRRRDRTLIWGVTSAVVLMVLGGGLYFYFAQREHDRQEVERIPEVAIGEPEPLYHALAAPKSDELPDRAGAAPETALEQLPGVIKALRSGLRLASEEGVAQDHLIVLADGRLAGRDRQSEENTRHLRWELRFPADITLEIYARQLDALGIELAVIGGADEVTYISKHSQAKPESRAEKPNQERRLYMTWRQGSLRDADEQLAAKAQIPTQGKIVAQFYPEALEEQLAALELERADMIDIADVRKTIFGIKNVDNEFKLYVIEQQTAELKSAAEEKPAVEKKEATSK